MRSAAPPLLALALAVLAGCAKPGPPPMALTDEALAERLAQELWQQSAGPLAAAQQRQLARELATLRAAAARAEQQGLGVRADGRAALELARLRTLQELLLVEPLAAPVTAEELRAAYAIEVGEGREYHLQQIQLATQAQAQQALMKLELGVPFAQVAASDSLDASKARGGDLGFVRPERLPAELAAAVRELAAGAHSAAPVRSAYGWHLLKVLETRQLAPPPLEPLRPKLTQAVLAARRERILASLRNATPPE